MDTGAARAGQQTSAANLRLALLAVLLVLVGAGAGYGGSLLVPDRYAARAELQYRLSQAEPNELLREDRTLTTQLVLLRSRVVLGPVAADNGLSAEDLTEDVSAEVVDSSEIIQVEVRAATRERAQALLTAVTARYLALANGDGEDPIRSFLEFRLGEVQQELRAPGRSPEATAELTAREETLLGLLDPLHLTPSISPESVAGPPAQLLTLPYPVEEPVGPTPLVAAATGATTALVVGGFVVLMVVRRRLRS